MYLIVGLGNPGQAYHHNRHNVGFLALDEIASVYKAQQFKQKGVGLFSLTDICGEKVLLLKPMTYMNLSGQAVLDVAGFFKVQPKDMLVIHDEIDLNFLELRLKFGGGHAGHNGLRDISRCVGVDYWRLRVGVGRPLNKAQVSNHVLSNFTDLEKKPLEEVLYKIARGLPHFFSVNKNDFINNIT